MRRDCQPVFALETNVEDDDVGGSGGIFAVERRRTAKPAHIKTQPGQAEQHFFTKVAVVINQIDQRPNRPAGPLKFFFQH